MLIVVVVVVMVAMVVVVVVVVMVIVLVVVVVLMRGLVVHTFSLVWSLTVQQDAPLSHIHTHTHTRAHTHTSTHTHTHTQTNAHTQTYTNTPFLSRSYVVWSPAARTTVSSTALSAGSTVLSQRAFVIGNKQGWCQRRDKPTHTPKHTQTDTYTHTHTHTHAHKDTNTHTHTPVSPSSPLWMGC
jgi:hypothetical protein